jgi:hypothetical protein
MQGSGPPKRKAVAAQLVAQGPSPAAPSPQAPFSPEVQAHIFRLLLEDTHLAEAVAQAVGTEFFSVDPLRWAWWQALVHKQQFNRFPSMLVVRDLAARLPATHAAMYLSYFEWIRTQPRVDHEWLRAQTIEFVGRIVFRKAIVDSRDLFNADKYAEAYDLMKQRMVVIEQATYSRIDRGWYADEFIERTARRMDAGTQEMIGTGFPKIDKILGGGARPGFCGLWLARAKKGKTTTLINILAAAARVYAKRCVYFTLEGGREIIEERLDAIFTGELLSMVRAGNIDAKKYTNAVAELKHLKGLIVIESIGGFNVTILDVERRLRELEQAYGFVPDLAVLDYVDILNPIKDMGSVAYNQIAACQQWKTLMEQKRIVGWSASQGTRPDDDADVTPTILTSANIADAYGKVRIVDLWGSVNQTKQEREQHVARMYIEGCRVGPADELFYIRANFETMSMGPMEESNVPQAIKNAGLLSGKKAQKLLAPGYTQGSM